MHIFNHRQLSPLPVREERNLGGWYPPGWRTTDRLADICTGIQERLGVQVLLCKQFLLWNSKLAIVLWINTNLFFSLLNNLPSVLSAGSPTSPRLPTLAAFLPELCEASFNCLKRRQEKTHSLITKTRTGCTELSLSMDSTSEGGWGQKVGEYRVYSDKDRVLQQVQWSWSSADIVRSRTTSGRRREWGNGEKKLC